jgi:molecular chaperone GrpE (heat shock protein)
MKGEVQELAIQLTQEMYKKGGTSWFELMDGTHEIFVRVKLKGKTPIQSTGIIEVDTTTLEMETISGNRAVTTGKPDRKEEKKEKCVCKEYNLIWGAKVSCEFRKKVVEISKKQNFDPNYLMAVMKVETSGTFSPSKIELRQTGEYKKNGNHKRSYRGLTRNEILKLDENFVGAVGLIQFTPAAINGLNNYYNLNLTKRKLALMTDIEQLDYVEKYIVMWKHSNKIKNKLTLADLYLLVFAPSKMNGSDDNTTLYKEGTNYYEANKSIDTDGKDGITKKELAKRAYDSHIEGKAYKEKKFNCNLVSKKGTDKNEKGILDEMKELVDKHIPYSQQGVRNSMSKEGLKALDCSETVAIYLYKLGITSEVKAIYTGLMTTQNDFRKAINSDNIDFVSGSNKSDFKPQRGDIFVWRKSNGIGHTGIVYEYDEAKDLVTILEAIGKTGAVGESQQVKNGGYSGKGCSRTAIYARNSGALSSHEGWKGYFRPKNYTKKL